MITGNLPFEPPKKFARTQLFGNYRENNNYNLHNNTPQSRRLRAELLECRDMLSINPVLSEHLFPLDNDLPVAFVSPLDQAVPNTSTATNFILAAADVPAGYNAHDWEKVETAKAVNGLTGYIAWEEIEDEMRLTKVYADASGSLDLSDCTALLDFEVYGSQLTALDVSGCTALISLSCGKNQMTSLNVSRCTALQELTCGNNQLASLDLSSLTALQELQCENNQLTSLDVSDNITLERLKCSSNQLKTLDVSKNTVLHQLLCDSNQLTSLDLSNNTNLWILECSFNKLETLDVSNNAILWILQCSSNHLTTCVFKDNTELNVTWPIICAQEYRTPASSNLRVQFLDTPNVLASLLYRKP